jgi:hypothetical protein
MAKETYFNNGDVLRELGSDLSAPNEVTVHTAQNLEPVAELADQLREHHKVIGHRKSHNLVPICEIPMIEYERAFREGWVNDPKAWKKWMNDPVNKMFRITDGRA